MHKLYANNGENSVNDILACHNMSIKYFVINCIFKKGSILGNFDRKYVFTEKLCVYECKTRRKVKKHVTRLNMPIGCFETKL